MDALDMRVLSHVGRYTITLRRVLEVDVFEGGSSNTVLNRLVRTGYLQRIERGLPGNFSYYQLAAKGAGILGIPVNKTRKKEPKGLATDLAALWFSCMAERKRLRLATKELRNLFGAPPGANIIYVAQAGDGEHGSEETTVFRLFIPEPTSILSKFSLALKRAAHTAVADNSLIRWIERGTYRFAVAVSNDGRKEELEDLIRSGEFPDLRIHVELAPSLQDLPRFIPSEREEF